MDHCANAVQFEVHDLFLEDKDREHEDPLSLKKAKKRELRWSLENDALGFYFDGNPEKHTMLLTKEREELLHMLKQWFRLSEQGKGVPWEEFQSVMTKLRNAFVVILAGRRFFTPLK